MIHKLYPLCIVWAFGLAALVGLSACEGGTTREVLGLERQVPDEFRVVSRPPLSMPPDFTLRPPRPGAPSVRSQPSDQRAAGLLLGSGSAAPVGSVSSAPTATTGESQFLTNARAHEADPSIRDQLYQEQQKRLVQQEIEEEEDSWLDLGWGDDEPNQPVVDAAKERERIEANKKEGKPITEGEVPVKGGEESEDGSVVDAITPWF